LDTVTKVMVNKLIPAVVAGVLRETLGDDVYLPSPVSGRLKTGQRVIRVIGSSPWYPGSLLKQGDDIFLRIRNKDGALDTVLVPDDGEHDDLDYRKWEWRLLHRGAKTVEQQLRTELEKRGYSDIEVQVGGFRCYDTSIAFKYRDPDEKPGPPELSLLFTSLPPAGSEWSERSSTRFYTSSAIELFILRFHERFPFLNASHSSLSTIRTPLAAPNVPFSRA
jgi:hypothetical protein